MSKLGELIGRFGISQLKDTHVRGSVSCLDVLAAVSLLGVSGCVADDPAAELSDITEDVVLGSPTADAMFGAIMAAGDFDGDGIDDLAVSAPSHGGGSVFLYRGTSSGLVAWRRIDDVDVAPTTALTGDQFGNALAVADIDHDGKDDLVIGAPNGHVAGHNRGGVAYVLFGGSNGPSIGGAVILDQASLKKFDGTSLNEGDSDNDRFGDALALRTLTSGSTWLAVGVPGEGTGSGASQTHYGFVNVIQFTSSTDSTTFGRHPSSFGTIAPPSNVDGSAFGSALLIRDLDNDGHRDVIVGAPNNGFGKVFVYRGTGSSFTSPVEIDEDSNLQMRNTDRFGWTLAEGRFDAVHYPGDPQSAPFVEELLIAAPGFGAQDDGRIYKYAPTFNANGTWTGMHVTNGYPGVAGEFGGGHLVHGNALVVRDLDVSGLDDFITSAPQANSIEGLLVIYMNSLTNGLQKSQTMSWLPSGGSDGNLQLPTLFDNYGVSLAMGNFHGSGHLDLVGGMPFRSNDGDNSNPADNDTGAFYEYTRPSSAVTFVPTKYFDAGTQ